MSTLTLVELRDDIAEMAATLEDDHEVLIDWRDLAMTIALNDEGQLEDLYNTLRDLLAEQAD